MARLNGGDAGKCCCCFSSFACTASFGGVESEGGQAAGKRYRWHAGDIHTLLGPEKTSTVVVFGFSGKSITAVRVYRRGFLCLVPVVGGGWLLVEMCIVDASILFSAPRFFCLGVVVEVV